MRLNILQPDSEKQPWYADGLSFTCTQCGNCCTGGPGYVWLTRVEITRLAEFLKMTPEQVVERYCRMVGGRFSLNERRNGRNYDCIFLEEVPVDPPAGGNGGQVVQTRRICRIYPVRPLQCRTWPFWPENLRSEKVWELSARRCPGMNIGRSYTREQIESIRDARDWPDRAG